jgi:HrpA-like RNA helicase
MVKLPLEPHYSYLLLQAVDFRYFNEFINHFYINVILLKLFVCRCVSEVLTIVSLLSSDSLFLIPHQEDEKKLAGQAHRRFASKDGDLPTFLSIYEGWLKVHFVQNFDER